MSKCMATGCNNDNRKGSYFCSDACLDKEDRPQKSSRNQTLDVIRDHISCAHDLQDLKEILQYEILPLLED